MSWPSAPLASVAEVRLGRQRSPGNHSGTHMRPYMRAANVGWRGLQLDDVKSMNFTDAEMSTYQLESGDLLLSEASGSAKEVGKAAIWCGEIEECAFQNTLLRVRSCGPEPRYLLHFFRFMAESGGFGALSRGVGIHHLGREALAALRVPLPPIEDQRRITAILEKADEIRAKRKAILVGLDAFGASMFVEMFGDPVLSPRSWTVKPLRRILDRIDSGSSPVCLDRAVLPGEHGVLKLGAVTRCVYRSDQNKALPPNLGFDPADEVQSGDLLFARKNTRDLVGACAYVWATPPGLLLSDLVFRLVINKRSGVEPIFLHQLLVVPSKQKEVRRLAGGSAGSMPNISKARLLDFEIEVPPEPLQTEFVAIVRRAEEFRSTLTRSLAVDNALFESVQRRAFLGTL